MNHGCSTTIPRPDGKVRNGTRKVLLVRKKHAWADPGWKPRLLFFSTAVALCTKNLYLQDRQKICQDLLGRLEIETIFLHKVITGDESWVSDYDPETKRQSEEWHTKSSCPKKARMSRSRVKTMIIVYFDSRGIVHKEFVPPGQTVNHVFYKDVLERLWKQVQRVRRDIADDWVLQHSNTPANTALSIREFLEKKNIPVLPHPPYSPDLALCDFCLFPKLKSKLKGHHFGTMENIQKL